MNNEQYVLALNQDLIEFNHPIAAAALPVSGLYLRESGEPVIPANQEELRLDVDGRYPQMTASGVIKTAFSQLHWIANLASTGTNRWEGNIWYKDGTATLLPYDKVVIQVTMPSHAVPNAIVTFSSGVAPGINRNYVFNSVYFHPVEFEFDTVAGVTAITDINTHDHPNRPASLPAESLSIEAVYQRAGFDVRISGGNGSVPLEGAGANALWSDLEMHDAMQTYWSRFANRAQWSLWTLFASRHEDGVGLGGIMFDSIGPNHRQGTSLFLNSFISQAPAGDPNPTTWVRRMRFWTAVHEVGHAFNLAHAWEKAAGLGWIPLANNPEARSFMNYPYNVIGGTAAFYANFDYRFINSELLFMRHAPERFVQMGNAAWFDHHGFEQLPVAPEPDLRLELRVNRAQPVFEFMEPVVIEMKLTNIGTNPQLLSERVLRDLDGLTFIIKKDGKDARQFVPFSRACWQASKIVLYPDESLYESLFVSAGRNGWDLAEPGYYTLQVALNPADKVYAVVSQPLRLRVLPPRDYDEELIAQDFFSEDVGRILTFDGSRVLTQGTDTLREVSTRLANRRAALHARIALANAEAIDYKKLVLPVDQMDMTSVIAAGGFFREITPRAEAAKAQYDVALITQPETAAESLGHIDYKYYADRYSAWLQSQGDSKAAAEVQDTLEQVLTQRQVLPRILHEVAQKRDSYAARAKRSSTKKNK